MSFPSKIRAGSLLSWMRLLPHRFFWSHRFEQPAMSAYR